MIFCCVRKAELPQLTTLTVVLGESVFSLTSRFARTARFGDHHPALRFSCTGHRVGKIHGMHQDNTDASICDSVIAFIQGTRLTLGSH